MRSPSASALNTLVSVSVHQQPLHVVLADIARQARLSWAADRTLPGMDRPATLIVSRVTARVALQQLLADTPLRAVVSPSGQVVIVRRVPVAPSPAAVPLPQPDARRERLSGFVRSAASNEVVRRAVITIDSVAFARQTNEEGFYALQLPIGRHVVSVRALGFAPFDTVITLAGPTTRDFVLRASNVVLSEVKIAARRRDERPDLDPNVPDMSVVRLDLKATRLIPPLLGEVDPIRTLTLLPGVSTSSDASTAISVRGGAFDQNLIQLDEATLYNPTHIAGFLSTFNSDAVDDVTLYKGAIPARFGGRVSSVVDVRQREGNSNEFQGNASVGLLSTRAIVEGPLFGKGRGSWLVAGRRSYADAFLAASSDTAINDNRAYFYDLNAKATVRLGQSGSLVTSGYVGRDFFAQKSLGFNIGWGNRSAMIGWNQAIANRLFSKVTATTSGYEFLGRFRFEPADSAQFRTRILSGLLRVDETLQLTSRQRLEFGAEYTAFRIEPGAVAPRGDTVELRPRRIERRHARAIAGYLGHEIELTDRLGVRYGIRWAGFDRIGPGTTYRFANDAPVVYNAALRRYEPGRLVDSSSVTSRRSLAAFQGWEPRASAKFSLTPRQSLKASYARTQQFVQTISRNGAPTPFDVWEPVGEYIKPLIADQVALGYSGQGRGIELTAEIYYKDTRNVMDFLDGADIILNPRIETSAVAGFGRAYGLELYLRRTVGRTSGWVSYTLSRAEQRFPVPPNAGATSGGGVNGGDWYASPIDRRHVLSVAAIRPISNRWTFGSTFQLSSGLPVTLPESRYLLDGILVAEYAPRNSSRLPMYHRLDVNFTRTMRRNGELQLGVFNLYNRFNAQSLRVRQGENNPLLAEAVQTSIFGIIPSVNYVFRF
jgi:hypothetical protein